MPESQPPSHETPRTPAQYERTITDLQRALERVERERDRLRRENDRLKEELEAARRAGARQAAPFSKGAPRRRPRRPGRKAGAAYGRQGQRAVPAIVHERYDVPAPTACPRCGDVVEETHVAAQYQEDLPPVAPIVRRFAVHIGCCRGCRRRVQGRHPFQTSDALGAAGVQLGPRAIAVAVTFNKQYGLSFGKVAAVYQTLFGLSVTRGAWCERCIGPRHAGSPPTTRCARRSAGVPS